MPTAEIVLSIACCIVLTVIAFVAMDRFGPGSYSRRYDEAMQKDLEYARKHPGCTWEEAHRHREKVMKRHGL